MRLFHNRKTVDEREQAEMMKIEHYMYWFTFWVLLISIFGQLILMKASFRQVAGEWAVFMLTAVGTVIGELKGGHFDYNCRPGWRSYLAGSVAAALAFGLIVLVGGITRNCYENVSAAIASVLVVSISAFVVTYILLAAAGAFVRYRRRKLEEEYDKEL